MALTREDLEKRTDWTTVESTGIRGIYLVLNSSGSQVDGNLKAAAPKLALACLEALATVDELRVCETGRISRLVKQLRAALEAAGVEVPSDGH